MNRLIWWLIVMAGTGGLCLGEAIPVTRGTTLAGSEMELPRDLGSGFSILVLGFSQKSSVGAAEWGKGAWKAFRTTRAQPCCYEIPVLAGLPRLFRGIVLRTMKAGVPAEQQQSFLPIFEKEREWKAVAGFSEPDDAYVLLVRQSGEVVWRTHGKVSQAGLAALKKKMEEAGQ